MFRIAKTIIKKILPFKLYNFLRKKYWKLKKWHPIGKVVKRLKRFILLAIIYPVVYKWYSRKPINDNKILLIEPEFDKLSNNYTVLYDTLRQNYDFDIHIHLLHDHFSKSKVDFYKRCIHLIKDIATAQYAFMDFGCDVLGRISFRKETQIVQLWHACGAFKKFGFSTAELIFGTTRKEMNAYPSYKYCTYASVCSPDTVWAYAEAMGLNENQVKPWGVSRTDVFFQDGFKENAEKKFELFMPTSKGKKIILFAPTFRGRVAQATTSQAFSIPLFFEALSEEYVLVIKHHPFVKKIPIIPEKYRKFAVDFTNVMDIEELLCVADICITDYSTVIFEYSLFTKPMIFFAYDLDDYFDWRGFYYNYDELTPGPVCKTNREMIDYIKHVDESFNPQEVIDFRKKFMSSCDGHSTERIMSHVFGDDLAKHKKKDLSPNTEINTIYSPKTIEDHTEEIKKKLSTACPDISHKKIIAYFMTPRKKIGYPVCKPYIDWQLFYEYLNDNYVVLYNVSSKTQKRLMLPPYYKKMFVNCVKKLTEQEMIQIADIIVADYQKELLQYNLNKPFFIYIPDYLWYCSSEKDYNNSLHDLKTFGYVKESSYDLISSIEANESNLSYENFANDYWQVCGHFHKTV